MSVYGMGSLFCGTEEQLDNFVNEGFVCIGWKKEDKPELYAILNNIKIGDIIYIKALPLSSKTMRIKAVGIVTTALKTENTHHGYEECGNEIGIKWLKSNINKSIKIKNSIFRNSLIFQGLPPIKYQNLMYFPLFLPL